MPHMQSTIPLLLTSVFYLTVYYMIFKSIQMQLNGTGDSH